MSRLLTVSMAVLLCLTLASCGGTDGGGAGPDLDSPTVSGMSITDGETDVGLIDEITVTFSEPMDAATINDTTFVVAGRSATGQVVYDDATRTASFQPDTLLAAETWHILQISSDVADEEGNLYEGGTTSFQTGLPTCDNLLDRFEPDDDIAGATSIELDTRIRALTQCEGRTDYDYFQFTVDETVQVFAASTFRECIDDLGWSTEFMRADGEMYVNSGTSGSPGDTRGWYYTFLPGTYWVRVHSNEHDPWGFALYDFELEAREPCRDDEYEDNDFIDHCAQILPNATHELVGCLVDADWFWVDLELGETLTITVTTHDSTHRRLRLVNADQIEVGFYNGSNDPASLSYTATRSGTHFFMTRFWIEGTQYELDVEVD